MCNIYIPSHQIYRNSSLISHHFVNERLSERHMKSVGITGTPISSDHRIDLFVNPLLVFAVLNDQ